MVKGRKKKRLIGEELISAGLVTLDQLKFALKEQRKLGVDKERLGEIIIKCGFVDEELMTIFLEKYLGVPYMNLRSINKIDRDLLKLIPEKMARNFVLVAVSIANNKLHVAMANPFDVIALDTLKLKTGRDIQVWFSRPKEVEEAIERFYVQDTMSKSIHDFIDLKEEETKKGEAVRETASKLSYKELEAEAAKEPIVKYVNELLENAVTQRASDIHIEPREKELSIRYRIDGILNPVTPPPKAMEAAILTRIKLLGNMNIAEHRLPQDGRFKFKAEDKEVDIRLASAPTIFGEKLVLRILDKSSLLLKMEELGLGENEVKTFEHILKQPYGMVLVTGPTGSGKTTTLYSALSYMCEPGRNIVTIEDPVEYQLNGINQIQIKPLIGLTFASSLRTILRQDPDVIMIGEIRDLETLENAVKASLTGHLVLSTIHTNDAPSVVYRMIHMGLEPYLIVACLNLVIAQRLIRRICKNCKEKIEPSEAMIKGLENRLGVSLKDMNFYNGKGCKKCGGTGYRGRLGVYEFFVLNDEIKRMISEGVGEKGLKKLAMEHGMKDLLHNGLEKVNMGLTTIEEVLHVTFIERAE